MPQRPTDRRDFESQKLLLEQELQRLYGSDEFDLEWARETLLRLETRRGDIAYSDLDHADLNRVRTILDRAKAIATFYYLDQPRDRHGRWTSGGTLDVQKAVAKLENAAGDKSSGKCATNVMDAVKAGGIVPNPDYRPKSSSAKDYGDWIEHSGFDAVTEASAGQSYPPKDYQPRAGDVVIIQPSNNAHPDGHMAMFNGKQWVSDYWQTLLPDDPTGF